MSWGATTENGPPEALRRAGLMALGQDEPVPFDFDCDRVAFFVAAFEDGDRQGIADLALDDPAQRARPEVRVVSVVTEPHLAFGRDLDGDAPGFEPLLELPELDPDNCEQVPSPQGAEADDLVDAVDELRLEGVDGLSPQVGGHDQHGIGEVDSASLAVGQAPVVQQLQQDVE